MKALGAARVMVVIDPHLTDSETVAIALESLKAEGLDTVVFDQVRVEPTDTSLKEAIDFATAGRFDGYVAIGGGSTIDTAKVADLYTTYPADFLEYVNAPIGKATPVPGPLAPLIAIPTTAGTGSEATRSGHLRPTPTSAPRPASPTGPCGPAWASSTPTTRAPCPAWPSPARPWTSSATPSSRYTALPFEKREAPDSPQAPPVLPGSQPHQQHVGGQGPGDRLQVRAAGHGRSRRSRGPHQHDPGLHHRGHRVRLGGSDAAARYVVPHLGDGARLQARGLSHRPSAHPARDVGDTRRAGGLPLHGARRTRRPAWKRRRSSAPTHGARARTTPGNCWRRRSSKS